MTSRSIDIEGKSISSSIIFGDVSVVGLGSIVSCGVLDLKAFHINIIHS
jgi:hypothetical protein